MFDADLLTERARITPDRLAVVAVESGERLTYRELDERAERAAATLREVLAPGERFGLLAFNCIEFLELFFGAGKAGVIVVPLSTRATSSELEHVVRDCSMSAIFYGDGFAQLAGELQVASRFHVAYRSGRSSAVARAVSDEATYCLLYTSGTTGKPKGVMIPRRQLYWNGYNTAMNWGLREDDVSPVFTPLYHAGGLAAFMIPIFCAGGTVVLHKGFDPAEVWRTFERERCTVALGVPTIWKLLMEAPEFAEADLSSVRWLISGGAPLPTYLIEAYRMRGIVLKQGYGMTEVGVNCFSMTTDDALRKQGSIGKPMMFTALRLVDPDGHEVAEGEIGEMWIRGPHVSSGYWNNEEATRATCTDGWLHTGDLARRDEEGFVYIAGRRKEMFISGGVNVYPAEIESALVAHPAISDAAVVAMPDDTWGEVGVAFVVARDLDASSVCDYLATKISKYKIPKKVIFLDALPRTPYGKVQKTLLADQLEKS